MLGPVGDAVKRNTQPDLWAGCHRIVKANALDKVAITARALIGCDDGVEGSLLCATAGKSEDNHAKDPCLILRLIAEKPSNLAERPRPNKRFTARSDHLASTAHQFGKIHNINGV
jgi:hypothetical protein